MPYGSLSLAFALEIPLDFIPFPVSLSLLGLPGKCFDLSTCWAPASPASFSLLPSCPLKPPHPNGRDRSRPAPGTHGIAAPGCSAMQGYKPGRFGEEKGDQYFESEGDFQSGMVT